MSALNRIRRRLGPPEYVTPRAFFDLDTVRELLSLADAVRSYVDSEGDGRVREFDAMHSALIKLEEMP